MKRIKILILGLILLLPTSCKNNSDEIEINIISNRSVFAQSSIGTQFSVNLPNVDGVSFLVSSSFGHIGRYPDLLESIVVNENEHINWIPGIDASLDQNGNYYKYGFIEGIINKDDKANGYFLLGLKNYLPYSNSYDYRINYISTLYDESLNLEEINNKLNSDKTFYKSFYFFFS